MTDRSYRTLWSLIVNRTAFGLALVLLISVADDSRGGRFAVTEGETSISIVGDVLDATIQKVGYVSGVAGGSLRDHATGARDIGFGLDIVDWLIEPGSDESYRDKLTGDLPYLFNNLVHGKRAKRCVEGPQICTQAKRLAPAIIEGNDFVAITQKYVYNLAAPGRKTGSTWDQTIVFPAGKRYFVSSDRITSVNDSESLSLRLDMPGHIKHSGGDTFSEVYLSYKGIIPSSEFLEDFAPDEKFLYVRDDAKRPQRMIRAYHLRDQKTGKPGPWLAGMTLDPGAVSEAWCHQRGYVCMIEEFGGRPIKAGGSFSAAFIVGFFDSIEEMNTVYDQYAGSKRLVVDRAGWRLVK
jgi:hypothetical protein